VPRTPARSPARPDPTALPDPLRLPWRAPATPDPPGGAPGAPGVPRDPRSDPGWAASLPEAGAAERRLIEAQIGRDVRGSVAVAARCRYGLPAVVRTAPLLPDGTPFPTLYWLACPAARVAVGRLEAAGWNARLSERVAAEPDLAAAHAAAHASYLAQRDAMAPLPGAPGVGGLPGRVKCLHALYAHHAATGADPVGRIVSHTVDPIDCPGPCVEAPTPPSVAPAPSRGAQNRSAQDRGVLAPGTQDRGVLDPGPQDRGGLGRGGLARGTRDRGAPEPHPPGAGAPEREGSPAAAGLRGAVHSPPVPGPAGHDPGRRNPAGHDPGRRNPAGHDPGGPNTAGHDLAYRDPGG